MSDKKAPNNRTLSLSPEEETSYSAELLSPEGPLSPGDIGDRTIRADLFDVLEFLPESFADMLFLDPPYNMDKAFNAGKFKSLSNEDYGLYIESFLEPLIKCLKPEASIYFCGDWRSSSAIQMVLERHFILRNRITWEREKGRGARMNWKNNSEDIWFATLGKDYKFNLEDVKLKRRVLAPYRDSSGLPKDWSEENDGQFRVTHPSNIWTDISVPFWSMPENTEHPTQKPEKLLAKLVLASTDPGDLILDPFSGSGSSLVVAKKLGRRFCGVEIDEKYACLGLKRLALSLEDASIQGYSDGIFWERNTFRQRNRGTKRG